MNVLVSYFDPFNGQPSNNSKEIALMIKEQLKESNINLKLCELRTVFDKAFDILDDCIKSSREEVDFIISLGEAKTSKVVIETRGINLDKSVGEDNDGISRNNSVIIPEAQKYLGVRFPLEKIYCSMSFRDKRLIKLSNSAGSFVCNNTLFHGLYNFELPYTFIHVPSSKSTNVKLNKKVSALVSKIIQMTTKEMLVDISSQPTTYEQVKKKSKSEVLSCEKSFYKSLLKRY